MKKKKLPKPSTGKKKDGFSIANIISIIGLVALAFCLYLGYAYSGVNSGTALLYSVLITVAMAFLLYFLLYAKRAESNFSKWRIVEYSLLGVFIGVCVALTPVLCHFINVNRASDELKDAANADLDRMEQAIKDFQDYENKRLSSTVTGLETVSQTSDYEDYTTERLQEYIGTYLSGDNTSRVKPDKDAIKAFKKQWSENIENLTDNEEQKKYARTYTAVIEKNRKRIAAWNILEIPRSIDDISALGDSLGAGLHRISSTYPLPKIGRNGSRYDILAEHEAFETDTEGSGFKDKCAELTGSNGSGVALSVVIFLLVIFNYIVAYRSSKVSVKAGSAAHDSGIILK